MAASAVPYTPGATISANPVSLHPGGSTVITAGSGYFSPDEAVTVAVSGAGCGSWAVPSLDSNAAGGTSFTLVAPAGSHGTCTVSLTSASASGAVVLTVTPATSGGSGSNPGNGGSGTIATTGTGGLAFTGLSLPMMLVWAVAALIALGVALLTVRKMKLRETRTSH